MIRRFTKSARAAAMIETVLSLAIILPVLSMTLYLGRGYSRVQRTRVMDRYEAWRASSHVRTLTPSSESDLWEYNPGVEMGPRAVANTDNRALNEAFLGGKAESVEATDGPGFPNDAVQDWIDNTARFSSDAESLLREMIERFPLTRSIGFVTNYPSSRGAIWGALEGPVQHGSARMEHEWRFANGWRVTTIRNGTAAGWGYPEVTQFPSDGGEVLKLYNSTTRRLRIVPGGGRSTVIERDDGWVVWEPAGPRTSPLGPIREAFFMRLDDMLRSDGSRGNRIASTIRRLYLVDPGYVGPAIGY